MTSRKISALRLVIIAALIWVSFLLYTHTVFRAVAGKKPNHPAVDFLRSGIVSKKFAAAVAEYQGLDDKGIPKTKAMDVCLKSKERDVCMRAVTATNTMQVATRFAQLILQDETRRAKATGHSGHATIHDAKVACALTEEKNHCMHDVLATGDIDTAEMYDKLTPKQLENARKSGRMMVSKKHAEQACVMIHKDDKEECLKHVMSFNDEETADHYVHLLRDQEALAEEEEETQMTDAEVKTMCAPVKSNQQECMKDVRMFKNKHIAEHFIELLHDAHDLFSMVSQRDAEKLCNHLIRENRPACEQSLVTMNAKDAAIQYSSLHKQELRNRPRLTQKEAESLCEDLTGEQNKQCQLDTMTMNDLEAAQKYAELLLLEIEEKTRMPPKESKPKESKPGPKFKPTKDTGISEPTKASGVSKEAAEDLCMRSNQRELCVHAVMATTSKEVGEKIANLFIMEDKRNVKKGRRPTVSLHDAQVVCALAKERAFCIHDVIGTGDLDTAEMFDMLPVKQAQKMEMSEKDIEQACRMAHEDEQEECQKQVMGLNDKETAEHYVHLQQDQEKAKEGDGPPLTEKEMQALCAPLKSNQELCMNNARVLKNQHIAEHFIELLHDAHDLSSNVSTRDAEKLCNHLMRKNREPCVSSMIKMNAKDAALHYSKLHKAETIEKPPLTQGQAEAACSGLPKKSEKQCQQDALTMNDVEVAQKYAQLLLSFS